uniref:Flagellar hook-length control protein FliK n=1 Tax=Desulfobacca acetoxidans TaxID=60893 RepID=A0A7C3WQF3_9BACT
MPDGKGLFDVSGHFPWVFGPTALAQALLPIPASLRGCHRQKKHGRPFPEDMFNAQTPAVPLWAGKSAPVRAAPASPAPDRFMTMLQGRLVTHLQRKDPSLPGSERAEARAAAAPPVSVGRFAGNLNPGVKRSGDQPADGGNWRLPPEQIPEMALLLLQAGFPAERLQMLLADPEVQEQGLSLMDLRRAWPEGLGRYWNLLRASEAEPGQANPGGPLLPGWAGFLSLAEQSPRGVLPVPPSRLPEVVAFLQEAGFSPKQVETLLASPQVQEQGLTAALLRENWAKMAFGSQMKDNGQLPFQLLAEVTSRADYRRLWERLQLPPAAMPDLRQALQQLGVTPEALASLEEHATPQGLPVGQVWRVIKESLGQGQAGDPSGKPAETAFPLSAAEVAQWRHLLRQAAFSPETVEALLDFPPPVNAAELRARLASLAPSYSVPKSPEGPKPLYLPEDLQLRSLWWKNHTGTETGLGDQRGHQEQASHLGESGFLREVGSGTLGVFPGLLASAPFSAGDTAGSGRELWGNIGPEVRQAFWSQVEAGILRHLRPGESRLSLVLHPPHLGQIELLLNLKGEDLAVTAMISRPDVAYLAGAGVEQLVQALSQHGLVLSQFHVQLQAGPPGSLGFSALKGGTGGKKEGVTVSGETFRRRRTEGVDRFV